MDSESQGVIRLSTEIMELVHAEARSKNLDVNDVVSRALAEHYGLDMQARFQLTDLVRAKAIEIGGSDGTLDPHIIWQVFQVIESDAEIRPLYDQAIAGPDGVPDPHARRQLHGQLARTIRSAVNGRAYRRYIPEEDGLIKSYSLLERVPEMTETGS